MWRNEALFPEGHPYRVTTIGKHEDIENAKLEDVQAFFKKWYVPNGASLAIVGDFDPAEAKALVQKYFGDIPRGADPTPITSAPATLPASKVLHYESRVPHHQVSLAWLSPPLFAEGDATLDFVASMLTEGADSRLYQELVQKQQIAKDVVAYQGSARLASQFIIQATAAPGHSTDELVAASDAELAKLAAAPPPADELELIRTGWEVRVYGSLQTIAGKSGQLSSYNSLLGDPGALGRDLARYQAIIANPDAAWVPRTVVLAGKAASAYHAAKGIIALAHDIARVVNSDPRVGDKLKLAYLPNYGVSLAEIIMPAADLSEQISTAGTEASGTGNMKFSLNGALTIGTWDGANIEMAQAVGEEHFFIFGLRTEAVEQLKALGYDPRLYIEQDRRLQRVLAAIGDGSFSQGDTERYRWLVDSLTQRDTYLLMADFADYLAAQERVDALYADPAEWGRKAVLNIAGMGSFSSDRTVAEYVERVWSAQSLPPAPR